MSQKSIPGIAINRLSLYLRVLDEQVKYNVDVISSQELSKITGFSAGQIRKDLAYFGAFGTRGNGYNTMYLRDRILNIIGLHKKIRVIVAGAGEMGKAIIRQSIEENSYINIVGVFDSDPQLIGERITDLEVIDAARMTEYVAKENIKVAIIATPPEIAQNTAEQLVKGGIASILNLAQIRLQVPEDIYLHNTDLAVEIQSVIYYSSKIEHVG